MKVGIIGLGYWGPNLVRNFLAHSQIESVIACDKREGRLKFIKSKFPSVRLTENYSDLIDSDLDIIAIATPVDTHFNLAKRALEAGKHIWVEKPFTSSSAQGEELIETAEGKKLKIFVDHTFIYTGAVRKMKELVDSNELGSILHFDSVRINLGLFQRDINVIWDLAPHDLSIMNYVLSDHKVSAVSAHGIANYNGKENIAHISVYFEDNCFAHFHVNWTSPVKIRKMIVGGDKKMLVFDDMENFEKIKVYDAGIDMKSTASIHEALVQYRIGDMYSPKITQTEALAAGVDEFITSIKKDKQPLTSGYEGLDVVRILEATDMSIKNRGELIDLKSKILL
ncbi:MAG: Gfo/Idh/MocA family oxidoreductase [Ignavibacteriaceae bacterium]